MTKYRRKSIIKAWCNLPSNDVPRWVLALPGFTIADDGSGEIMTNELIASGITRPRVVPDEAWIVDDDGRVLILSPNEFADQFEEDKPNPLTISLKDMAYPPEPRRRFMEGGVGVGVSCDPGGGGTRI